VNENNVSSHKSFCFPSVIVAGFPKCSTSFVFKMLSTHPLITATKRKELCLGGVLSETWSKMINFLPNRTISHNKLILSGCLHLGANIAAMKSLCVSGTKVIYVVRDVADMLYAAYNYWCIEGYDVDCVPGKRTSKTDKRSSTHFHEMISRHMAMGGGTALTIKGICYRKDLENARRVYGSNNILVLKSEDFLNKNMKVIAMNKINDFIISENVNSIMQQKEMHSISILSDIQIWMETEKKNIYKVNAGLNIENRGEKSITPLTNQGQATREGIAERDISNNVYEISNYEPMLAETRDMIYNLWRNECLWLKSSFDVLYDNAC
jgi:hypothetical protein